MWPEPDYGERSYRGSARLLDRKAVITGGTPASAERWRSRFARGADVLLSYLAEEQDDAEKTAGLARQAGREAVLVAGDIQTILTVYWITGSIGSSFRQYFDWEHNTDRPHITVPTVVTPSAEPAMTNLPRTIAERACTNSGSGTNLGEVVTSCRGRNRTCSPPT